MSSLNHSYETLNNMSEPPPATDDGEDIDEAEIESVVEVEDIRRRKPHRPAPPVPVKEQFERSKEILFSQNIDPITGQRKINVDHRINEGNRRNMRYRKIHSVKRQIQIKEKMLEVTKI